MLIKPLVLLEMDQPYQMKELVLEMRVDKKPWYYNIQQYLDNQQYIKGASEKEKK